MVRVTHWVALAAATAALMAAAACGGASAGSEAGSTSPAASASAPEKVDLGAIFPQGAGRDIVLASCQNCHTFVPIVILQMDKDAWRRNSLDHRERVAALSDEQFTQAYAYLAENFGPHRPVPQLPPALLKSWTTY